MRKPTLPRRAIALSVLALAAASALSGVAFARAGGFRAADEVAAAADRFVATLDAEGRGRALFSLGDAERFDWHFVPRERNGLPLGAMTLAQRTAAHRLLRSSLSTQGYLKANGIVELERVLGIVEGREEFHDPEDYYFAVFGSPSSDAPWAWRFEGHHVSMSFSSPGDETLVTGPAFMGSNPATVSSGPKAGLRVLGAEEDLARELVTMLSPEQRGTAVIASEAYDDIVTGAGRTAELPYEGIRASALDDAQRAQLDRLIREYVGNMDEESARRWTRRIAAGSDDRLRFAWAGSIEAGRGHYYRVHSPDFLIEYDNTQNDANHVHSVWRDLRNDFGGDALRAHYEEFPHGPGTPHSAGRESHAEISRIAEQLAEWGPKLDSSVHTMTLRAFARRRLESGDPIDLDALGLFAGPVVKVKKAKK